MTAVLENGERHSLQCGTCYPGGYDGSRGYITKTQYQPAAREQEIIGIQVDREKTEYRFCDWSCYVVYETEAEAVVACESLRKEQEEEDHKRFVWKKQDAKRTWWWECGYFRSQIATAKRDLAYAEAKLSIAKSFVKETVSNEVPR